MSEIKVWIPLYVLVVILLIWRMGWKKGLVAIACIALAFFCDERINNLIKELVGRIRPCNDPLMLSAGINVLETGGGFSFPSGHACNSFGFAFVSALCFKWIDAARMKRSKVDWVDIYNVVIITWAILVAISRVMVARHFFGDVLVGAMIGTAMGIIWACIARAVCRRIPDPQVPCSRRR